MEKKIRYTLGKQERLKSRKAIDHLFKEGRSFSVFPFRILYQLNKELSLTINQGYTKKTTVQAGFTVSSRHFKKAVDRNRVKRLMREAWRLQKNELQALTELNKNTLTLFLIFIGKELPPYELVYEKTGNILNRLIKLTGENR